MDICKDVNVKHMRSQRYYSFLTIGLAVISCQQIYRRSKRAKKKKTSIACRTRRFFLAFFRRVEAIRRRTRSASHARLEGRETISFFAPRARLKKNPPVLQDKNFILKDSKAFLILKSIHNGGLTLLPLHPILLFTNTFVRTPSIHEVKCSCTDRFVAAFYL